MRVLFQPFAASTHVHAQVPLAWALRSAGHEVCVAAQPDVLGDITEAGLTAVPVGDRLDVGKQMNPDDGDMVEEIRDGAWLAALDPGDLREERLTGDHVQAVFAAWTPMVHQNTVPDTMIHDLVEFARYWRPDLVLWDTMTYAGPVAARASGAAHARLLFGLDLVGLLRQRRRDALAGLPPELDDDPLREWLGRSLDRYGLPFTEDLVVGQWTVDPVPSSLRLPVDHRYVPMRYVPYNGPAALPDWLLEPPIRPRVCLTLGVSFREIVGGDRASVADILCAMADLDVDVVATLSEDQLADLPLLPPNVRVTDFVPLDALLPSCAAIVHHGGSGTFLTALAHGVPQLVIPTAMWCNVPRASRAEAAGAALVCPPDELTPERLHALLRRILDDPATRRAALRLRRETLRHPAPAQVVRLLERLTAEHRD